MQGPAAVAGRVRQAQVWTDVSGRVREGYVWGTGEMCLEGSDGATFGQVGCGLVQSHYRARYTYPMIPKSSKEKPHTSPEEHAQKYACPLMCERGNRKQAKCSRKTKQAGKQDACPVSWAEVQTHRVIEDTGDVAILTQTKAILIPQRHACF